MTDLQSIAGRVADEIEKRGLARGTYADYTRTDIAGGKHVELTDANCKLCTLGAIGLVMFGKPENGDQALDTAVAAQLAEILRPDYVDNPVERSYPNITPQEFQIITMWNDEVAADSHEVVALFRRIAAGDLSPVAPWSVL